MKNIKILIALLAITATAPFAGAPDPAGLRPARADGGQGGAFPTINAAITAASAGDRILIYPKSGGSPYTENIVINKNLQLLCALEG